MDEGHTLTIKDLHRAKDILQRASKHPQEYITPETWREMVKGSVFIIEGERNVFDTPIHLNANVCDDS